MRRRIVIAASVGLILFAGSVAAWRRLHRASPPPCTGTERALDGVWDGAIKAKVHTAFIATKKAYAEPANAAVTKALDAYLAEWTTATVGNCTATKIRGEQTAEVMAIRQLCLDQRFAEARTLAEMLQDPSAVLVELADKAVSELDLVAGCANHAAIVQQAIEPRYRADYTRLLLQTAAAHAQAVGGQLVAAEGALMHAADEGRRIHANDLVALALHARAAVLFGEGRLDEAYLIASDAVWTAMLAHRDDIVMGAALTVASARAEGADHLDVADGWVKLASAAAARSGGFPPAFDERRLELVGVIAAQRGDLETAVTSHEQALAAATKLWGNENPALWTAEVQLATTLGRSGAWVQALPHFEHALRLREAAVGPDHPDVALILSNLAACYEHVGERVKALAAAKSALQIREKTYGPNSPFLVATLNNLADLELRQHELASALADIERAQAIAIRIPGPTSPTYHVVATTRAEVLGGSGRVAEARKAFDDVLALEDQNKSPELGTTLTARATLELAQDRWKDAATFEERAIAAYEAVGGPGHLSLWKPLAGLAQARRALDKKADVKPLVDRALAIGVKAQLTAEELDPIRAQLANL
ncbi:MAG TPA: tetratricopeptide repeat protein [Kofleriaceae bacterium]|nr:tetratricopeptide repeat protein [Kofleriaceae bacterium]